MKTQICRSPKSYGSHGPVAEPRRAATVTLGARRPQNTFARAATGEFLAVSKGQATDSDKAWIPKQ